MLAALWTELNYPLSHDNMTYIPDPTEKLQTSCSQTMPTPCSKSNPNNTHPFFISTSEPEEISRPHINSGHSKLKWDTYMHTQKMLITSIHINRDGYPTKWASVIGISVPATQRHKAYLIVCPSFSLNPSPFPSLPCLSKEQEIEESFS